MAPHRGLPRRPRHRLRPCDLGVGLPELGDVSLAEIEAVRGRFGLHFERDMNFLPRKPLSAYAREAREVGPIIA